jgi:hypothetical protein
MTLARRPERRTAPEYSETEDSMSQASVEERISALERTVAQLVRSRETTSPVKDWKRTVGMFSGNELMKEIDAAGQKIREEDRQRARRRGNGRRRKGK